MDSISGFKPVIYTQPSLSTSESQQQTHKQSSSAGDVVTISDEARQMQRQEPIAIHNEQISLPESMLDQAKWEEYSVPDAKTTSLALATWTEQVKKEIAEVRLGLREKYEAWKAEHAKDFESRWHSRFGMLSGTYFRKDGSSQVVSIKDNGIEILNYSDGKLKSKTTGVLDKDSVTTQTEAYNDAGEVVRTSNTVITGISDTTSKETKATMQRDVRWYENGEVVREMQEGKLVEAGYSALFEDEATGYVFAAENLDEMVNQITTDQIRTSYFAHFNEYKNGNLVRTASISYNLHSEAETDRRPLEVRKEEGIAHTSRINESPFQSNFSANIIDYDDEGNISRQAVFDESQVHHSTDKVSKKPQMLQKSSVSWFKDGELVKKSDGSLRMDKPEYGSFPDRPGIAAGLGLNNEEYASSRPKSAGELISTRWQETLKDGPQAGSPRWQTGYAKAGDSDFNLVENTPYEITMNEEYYKNGKLVARQEDTEKAAENSLPVETRFRTGKGLTEDDIPGLLRSSEHIDESYEDGRLKRHGEISQHETLRVGDKDTLILETIQSATLKQGNQSRYDVRVLDGAIEDNDLEYGRASDMWDLEADLTVTSAMELMGRVMPEMQLEDMSAPAAGSTNAPYEGWYDFGLSP